MHIIPKEKNERAGVFYDPRIEYEFRRDGDDYVATQNGDVVARLEPLNDNLDVIKITFDPGGCNASTTLKRPPGGDVQENIHHSVDFFAAAVHRFLTLAAMLGISDAANETAKELNRLEKENKRP